MADLFYFTYNYGNRDYYSGYGIANSGTYSTGQSINTGTNELGLNGNYTIDYLIRGGASSSDVGKIYTYAYYDGDYSKKSYTTYNASRNIVSGLNGLGSEIDYIYGAATGYDGFGQAFYEADAAGIALYGFTYDYSGRDRSNTDRYYGFFYGNEVAYQSGSTYDYSSGLNQEGYNGKYTITSVSTGYDSASTVLNNVYVYSYYDGDYSKKYYTPSYYRTGQASGTAGLGSEIDYIYGVLTGVSAFGQDYYEANSAGISAYTFTYDYSGNNRSNTDRYYGFFYASDVAYQVGSTYDSYTSNNEAGYNGKYTITSATTGYDSATTALNKVYVSSYYDGDYSKKYYAPYYYSTGQASGSNGLGSEIDYIYGAATGYDAFGQDYYEADVAGIALYGFTYDYSGTNRSNTDKYYGFFYGNEVAYQVGSTYDSYAGNNEAGYNGNYTITSATTGYDSATTALNKVYVSSYYDGDYSKKYYAPYYYSTGQASGSNGLGSEIDYIYGAATGYDAFGQDYYEADVAGIALYGFTYDYSGTNRSNTDKYYGFFYGNEVAYQVGSTYDSYAGNNEAGYNGNYTITSASTGYDNATSALNYVYVYSYYDGDYSKKYYTPLAYSQNRASGTTGLGSEIDNIYGVLTGYDYFGQDYYEADVAGISLYGFTYDYSGTNSSNTDRYYGFFYASDVAYQVGSTYDSYTGSNQAGFNGKYTITASYNGYDDATTVLNYVYVYSYYDGDYSGTSYTPFYYSQSTKQASGTSGLGSERDYIITARGDVDLFGYDFYEADNLAA